VWTGDDSQQVEFTGRKRVTPTANTEGSVNKVEGSGSKDYDQSEEIDSGLEEDQYPGE